jgi:serine-type D-Ala-D-Ala carboxypeptidase/endopeptidase
VLPDNLKPKDDANPYADYWTEHLYDFLAGYELRRDPGSKYEYSNLGMGLLGHVLSAQAGLPYEELVLKQARIMRASAQVPMCS